MWRWRGHGSDGVLYGAMGRAQEGWSDVWGDGKNYVVSAREGWGGVWGDGEGA